MPSVDDVKNRDAWCGKVYNLGDMEGAKAAFEMSTLDASINIYIRTADNGKHRVISCVIYLSRVISD